ncbi:MAG: hypothetical protein GF383_01670 [Candidatus Lokiarchaeota archaeon]|nr:hypothetical protein [Candidatus Lokiarchaeota archaeon]
MIEQKQEHILEKEKALENSANLTIDTEATDQEPIIEPLDDFEMLEEENANVDNSDPQQIISNIAQADPTSKSKVMDYMQTEIEEPALESFEGEQEPEDEKIAQFVDTLETEEGKRSKKVQEFTSDLVRNTINKIQYTETQVQVKSIISKHKFKYADNNTQSLSNFFRHITGLAYKQVPIDENLRLILLFPILICRYSRPLILEKTGMRAASQNSRKHPVIEDLETNLESIAQKLHNNLKTAGSALKFLQRQFQAKIAVKTSILKKELYFQSGKTQIKIVVNPIVVSLNEVGFLEASLQFAYYPQNNAHIVKLTDLNDLISYLESKYIQIESYQKDKSAKKIYAKAVNRYATQLQFSSVPFLACGVILFVLILVLPPLALILAPFSIGILCLYALLHGLLFYRFYAENKALHQSFQMPYHQELKADRALLIRCRPFFSEDEITQFMFELNCSRTESPILETPRSRNRDLSTRLASRNAPSESLSQTTTSRITRPSPQNDNENTIAWNSTISFILDGSNIARSRNNSIRASISDVLICKEELKRYGIPDKYIFVVFGAGLRHYVSEKEIDIYESLLEEDNVSQAPAGRDDDWFIISFAKKRGSFIVTNDKYREYKDKSEELNEFLKKHCIRFSIIGEDFFFEEQFENKLSAHPKSPRNGGHKELERANESKNHSAEMQKSPSVNDSIHKKFQSFLED